MKKQALILFTRVPVPGQTKTRMMPYLTKKQCADLHTCFLKDIQENIAKMEAQLFVYFTPEDLGEQLRPIFGNEAIYRPQVGEGLGQRMHQAILEVLGQGYEKVLLMGTDIPEITDVILKDAYQVLEKQDLVFGPTVDEGYYLVGMKAPCLEVFDNQEYGHGSVLKNTVSAAKKAGKTVGYVRKLHDVDEREDLTLLRERMREKGILGETYTGRFIFQNLKVSIIVPIYNESKTIEQMQTQLRPLQKKCEIIFVDGGSTDDTREKMDSTFTLLHSGKGRGCQMNLGAKHSTGDVLFFLHCDSELPRKPLREIRRVMLTYRVGCFGVAFHSKNFFMWTCRVISNHRIKDRRVMFGDQGIFLERELFFEAGMYPEVPILEDYELSLALKNMGLSYGLTRKRIYSSVRRFPDGTIPKLKLMWRMNRLRKMQRDGVPLEKIAQLYEDVR